jgi:hypothetical protein
VFGSCVLCAPSQLMSYWPGSLGGARPLLFLPPSAPELRVCVRLYLCACVHTHDAPYVQLYIISVFTPLSSIYVTTQTRTIFATLPVITTIRTQQYAPVRQHTLSTVCVCVLLVAAAKATKSVVVRIWPVHSRVCGAQPSITTNSALAHNAIARQCQ